MKMQPKLKSLYLMSAFACLALASGSVLAALTAQEIERLGKDLTPMGGERAGNKDGSIPAWEGGLSKAPAGFDPTKGYIDPFAAEKPLYTITAANAVQYKDKLAPGQLEMLKRYPSYKMNVYPSHRTAAFPQREYENIKAEAGKAELVPGGNGVLNIVKSAVPFPIPKTGIEAIWNHLTRYRGGSLERYSAEFPVQANGNFTPVTRTEVASFSSAMPDAEPNRLLYKRDIITGPSSMAGEALVIHEPMDQVKEPRLAWLYNPGQRRVVRAPDFAHDMPGQGSDGLRTIDDYDGFGGSPDRYDWKLVGKKEMLISYNNYQFGSKSVKYTDIVKPGHLNQDLVRYELHRVWVVEATLKPGKRHVYGKRIFFVDEDSWQIAHADKYDNRGELWRVHEIEAMQFYDAPTPFYSGEVLYDLQARRYVVVGLTNQEKPIKFGGKFALGFYSSDNLRRMGN